MPRESEDRVIFTWLASALRWLLKLVIPPPPPTPEPRIDPNEKCPSCGHTDGEIRAVPTQQGQPPLVRHTCKVCLAQWFVKPILDSLQLTAKPETRAE